ncbi:MAG: hypothetical protein B7Z66_09245 [Chromatiales bacterium 21-64-14]|nr:MAG: hypothetical protein B7Z66_09245 [Chromatiales bacterium 21-64-14]HQU17371.1 GspH/FimT family protein [Gammaproteobacteria bacterium]
MHTLVPTKRRRPPSESRGLTFLELLTTLAVSVVLASVAIPTFRWLVLDTRRSTAVNALVHDLALARNTAVSRFRRVALCPSQDGNACLPVPEWHQGWMVFVDTNRNRDRDGAEPVLWTHGPLAAGLSATSARARRRIVYQPLGTAGGSNLTVTFCDARGPAHARALIVSNSGRPRLARRTAGGGALHCPP